MRYEWISDRSTVACCFRFDLVAKAKLYKGCADDDVVFTWSFDRSFSYNADYESRATFTVEPYVLPGMLFSCLNCQLQTATAHIPHGYVFLLS